jgi:predicted ribosome quality control (RQC) complex YloA/Tae2 family protein
MKYAILRSWTNENPASGQKVAGVSSSGELLKFVFTSGPELVLVAKKRDSFPFWTEGIDPEENWEKTWDQLIHARLTRIRIADNDRIMYFHFEQTDIYQQKLEYVVVAEFMPAKPNIILTIANEELVIVDALRKYSYADNPQRQVLPKLPYYPPQTSFQAQNSEVTLPLVVDALDGKGTLSCGSVNEYLQNHYLHVMIAEAENNRKNSIRQHWENELKKARQKLRKQKDELKSAEKAEYWKQCAETIKHNLHNIKKGQTILNATNYYDPDLGNIEIKLQPDRSPQQNMRHYIKKYQKSKRGENIIRRNISETQMAVEHLEEILKRVDGGELIYAPRGRYTAGMGRKLDQAEKLLRLRLNEDFEIVIGRKARENDFITTQLAQPHDWWFHTRIYHGSHIILRCFTKKEPEFKLINACCSLAAWYSKARFSQNVPVDFTQVRYVRKPRKSAPGFVTYTNHNTVFADPKDLRAVREELLG